VFSYMLYRFSCDTPLNKSMPIQLSRYSDSLQAEGSGNGIPLGEEISLPVLNGAEAHPSQCTVLYPLWVYQVIPGGKEIGDWC
jgi:hypothetical protein